MDPTNKSNNTIKILKLAEGPARIATAEEIELDETVGITNPNLHTRIAPSQPSEASYELKPCDYSLTVEGKCSYRTTTKYYHDDNSDDSEIP